MTGPYNKKSQGSLRRLSFFKILLVEVLRSWHLRQLKVLSTEKVHFKIVKSSGEMPNCLPMRSTHPEL